MNLILYIKTRCLIIVYILIIEKSLFIILLEIKYHTALLILSYELKCLQIGK